MSFLLILRLQELEVIQKLNHLPFRYSILTIIDKTQGIESIICIL